MMRRLEQVAALIVAAGLALVSYWLFFSWAQGGGIRRPAGTPRSAGPMSVGLRAGLSQGRGSETAPRLEQPLLAGPVIERGDMGLHRLPAHGQAELIAEVHDAVEGAVGVL
jgi:hypothetical protein